MRTAKETFYFVEDVMKMLGLSRSKAYSSSSSSILSWRSKAISPSLGV